MFCGIREPRAAPSFFGSLRTSNVISFFMLDILLMTAIPNPERSSFFFRPFLLNLCPESRAAPIG